MNPNSPKSTEASDATMPWYADLVADLGNLVGGKNFGLRLSFLALLTAGGCAGGAMNQPPEGPQDINPRELQMLLIQNGLSTGIQPDGSKINDIKMVASGSLMDILGKEDELKKQGKTVKRLRFGGSFVLVVVEQETSKGEKEEEGGVDEGGGGKLKRNQYEITKNITPDSPEAVGTVRYSIHIKREVLNYGNGIKDIDNSEVAAALVISIRASQNQIYDTYKKLKIKNPSLKGKILLEIVATDEDGIVTMVDFIDSGAGMRTTLANSTLKAVISEEVQKEDWVVPGMKYEDDVIISFDFE